MGRSPQELPLIWTALELFLPSQSGDGKPFPYNFVAAPLTRNAGPLQHPTRWRAGRQAETNVTPRKKSASIHCVSSHSFRVR